MLKQVLDLARRHRAGSAVVAVACLLALLAAFSPALLNLTPGLAARSAEALRGTRRRRSTRASAVNPAAASPALPAIQTAALVTAAGRP